MTLVGEQAPEFSLESTSGGTVSLSETLESGPSVVLLFRGTWCSFCAEQLATFSRLAYDMKRHQDVDILPVAGAPVDALVEFRDRHEFRMQLLADPDFAVTRAYTEIREHREHGEHTRAGTFVVDPAGVVRYEHRTDHSADRRYANFVRYFVGNDYEDQYFDE